MLKRFLNDQSICTNAVRCLPGNSHHAAQKTQSNAQSSIFIDAGQLRLGCISAILSSLRQV